MAEFQTVIKERMRMCKESGVCNDCPLSANKRKQALHCPGFMFDFPEEAEKIIMQWASEHPIMTNGKKFEEV